MFALPSFLSFQPRRANARPTELDGQKSSHDAILRVALSLSLSKPLSKSIKDNEVLAVQWWARNRRERGGAPHDLVQVCTCEYCKSSLG